MLAVDKENTRTKPRSMHRGRDHARPLGLAASSLKDGLALSVQGPRVSVNVNGLVELHELGFDQACFLTKAHSTGFPKFFLKFSVKILWASRNSGVEKDKRGSSCFLRSSSFLTWRRISSRRDICSLSFLSTLDSYSASLSTSFCPNFAIVAPLAYDPAFSLSLSLSRLARAFLLFSTRTAAFFPPC